MPATALGIVVAAALAPAPTAQGTIAPGFAGQLQYRETAFPSAFRGFAVGDAGQLYVGAADELAAIDPLGNRQLLHRFASGGAGLVARPGNGSDLFFVEDNTSRAWRIDLASGAKFAGSVPANTFDLAQAPSGELLASANPNWPAPGAQNGIWLIDFAGGNHRELATLRGPSGPIAFDRSGDLYYAEQSATVPTPPGSINVWRFDRGPLRAALTGGPSLSLSQATLVVAGLDGAYDMAFDDQNRLYASDPHSGAVQRTAPGPAALESLPWLARPAPPATAVALQLHYLEGDAATFTGYQPARGGTMFVGFVDWFVSAEVHRFSPTRPVVVSSPTSSAPPGPVTFVISGLPPLAAAWLWVSPLPAVPEKPWLIWAGTPFWSGLDPAWAPIAIPGSADAIGDWQLSMFHRGGFAAQLQFQAAGVTAGGVFGTSTIYSLQLQP